MSTIWSSPDCSNERKTVRRDLLYRVLESFTPGESDKVLVVHFKGEFQPIRVGAPRTLTILLRKFGRLDPVRCTNISLSKISEMSILRPGNSSTFSIPKSENLFAILVH